MTHPGKEIDELQSKITKLATNYLKDLVGQIQTKYPFLKNFNNSMGSWSFTTPRPNSYNTFTESDLRDKDIYCGWDTEPHLLEVVNDPLFVQLVEYMDEYYDKCSYIRMK